MDESTDELEWLLGPHSADALQLAAELADPLAAGKRLRREHSIEHTRLVLELGDLRRRAAKKFPQAARMFFTRRALEQATDAAIAAYKAARFPAGEPLADLCCGIGGDLLALAERGRVVGVDADPAMVLLVRANLEACGLMGEVRRADVSEIDLGPYAAWHLDPDRRAGGRRGTRIEQHSPDREAIERMLAVNPNGAIKLAPAVEPPAEWLEAYGTEWEWISHGRECRQAVAWHGRLRISPGERRATVIGSDSTAASFVGSAGAHVDAAEAIGRFLFEPDPAVLAAGLTAALASSQRLRPIAPGAVYLTGDAAVDLPLLAGFEVLAVESWSEKTARRMLVAHDIGRLEVKKRGVDVDPARLAARLRGKGATPGVLFVTRIGKRAVAIVTRRLAQR